MSPYSPSSHDPQSRVRPVPSRPGWEAEHGNELSISELFANLWEGRYLIAGSVVCFLLLGGIYIWRATPIFEVTALLQTEIPRANNAPSIDRTEGMFAESKVVAGEIEIVNSNLVLGRTVDALALDISARPILTPVIGKFLARGVDAPRIEVESLSVPDRWRGKPFQLVLEQGDAFRWEDAEGVLIATGEPGQNIGGTYQGDPMKLKIRHLSGKPGQRFHLMQKRRLDAINDLRQTLLVEEKGRSAQASSNLIGLTMDGPDPELSASVLNEVMYQYIQQSIEKKSGESAKTLKLLQDQRPGLQADLAAAEDRLNQFRSRAGSVDLSREGEIQLQEAANLNSQITALAQRKSELLRTYNENADVVTTLNEQIGKLQADLAHVNGKLRNIPQIQQEVVRLSRDVQVKTELYTTLLNNIQQLQNTLAGEVGNARVVDKALPSYDAIAPKKKMLAALFLFIGGLTGIVLILLRRMLWRGIEDHRVIELKLGMPILVTIPHSDAQDELDRGIQNRTDELHLLAALHPEDLAAESFRSLRTALHLYMKEAENRALLITSPSPSVGKSFVTSNLGAILALTGSKVLVIDADLRRGNLHHYFGRKNRKGGLTDVLSGRQEWRTVVAPVQSDPESGSPEISGLDFMSTGTLPPNPSELLMSEQFARFTKEVSAEYDFVLFDAPPLLPVTDAAIIGANVGNTLLVAKYRQHSMDEMRTCQQRLESLHVPFLGCVFNNVLAVGIGGRYKYYKYAYHYEYR